MDDGPQSPRLLVTGARSLIGEPLLAQLARSGVRPLALSRRRSSGGSGADWLEADLNDPRLDSRLPVLATVISLSPLWLLPPAMPTLARRGATRLVAFSSTSRFTKLASPEADERAVAERLARSEAEVMDLAASLGVGATIFRPTMIYAEGRDGNVSRLARLIDRWGVLPLSGTGGGRRQPVHAEDLACAVMAALDAPGTIGRVYNLAGGETLTYRTMCERIFEGLGRTPRILSVPPALWAAGLAGFGRWLPGATAAMGERMAADLVFDDRDARRDLGWSPRAFHPRFAS